MPLLEHLLLLRFYIQFGGSPAVYWEVAYRSCFFSFRLLLIVEFNADWEYHLLFVCLRGASIHFKACFSLWASGRRIYLHCARLRSSNPPSQTHSSTICLTFTTLQCSPVPSIQTKKRTQREYTSYSTEQEAPVFVSMTTLATSVVNAKTASSSKTAAISRRHLRNILEFWTGQLIATIRLISFNIRRLRNTEVTTTQCSQNGTTGQGYEGTNPATTETKSSSLGYNWIKQENRG